MLSSSHRGAWTLRRITTCVVLPSLILRVCSLPYYRLGPFSIETILLITNRSLAASMCACVIVSSSLSLSYTHTHTLSFYFATRTINKRRRPRTAFELSPRFFCIMKRDIECRRVDKWPRSNNESLTPSWRIPVVCGTRNIYFVRQENSDRSYFSTPHIYRISAGTHSRAQK